MTKHFNFNVEAGMTAPNGKPQWPDAINIEMNRRRAFDIAQQILAQLRDEDEKVISFYLSGKIEPLED